MKEENEATASELSNSKENESNGREEVYTRIIRAGNRTYFLDVKSTRKNDLYLTITESKKRFNKDGKFFYEKHKLFLYQEDFEKFSDGLEDVFSFIRNSDIRPEPDEEEAGTDITVDTAKEEKGEIEKTDDSKSTDEFIKVEFEDLGEK
ncbi:MAG TPA: DNA-binding protein [Bacteroidales bacterium]|nr:DNA-binding protein [Bacteroidales bacterium]